VVQSVHIVGFFLIIVFTSTKLDENTKEDVDDKNLLRKYSLQYFQGIKTK
jgi:hypothetical protein